MVFIYCYVIMTDCYYIIKFYWNCKRWKRRYVIYLKAFHIYDSYFSAISKRWCVHLTNLNCSFPMLVGARIKDNPTTMRIDILTYTCIWNRFLAAILQKLVIFSPNFNIFPTKLYCQKLANSDFFANQTWPHLKFVKTFVSLYPR